MEPWDLIYAIKENDLTAIQAALDGGVCPDSVSIIGQTPLIEAVKAANIDIVKLLLDSGANADKADERVTMGKGSRPLAFACDKGLLDIASLLLQRGADPDGVSKYYETPLGQASDHGFCELVEVLIEGGAKIDGPCGFDGMSPLMVACKSRQVEAARLLIKLGANIKAADEKGRTPLHYASGSASGSDLKGEGEAIVSSLIEGGADVNHRDKRGETPLFDACRWSDSKIVKLLIEAGSDVNVRNNSGKSPIYGACSWNCNKGVVDLLIKGGAKVDFVDEDGNTLLHISSSKDTIPADAVASLCEARGDVHAKDSSNQTPLHRVFSGLSENFVQEEKALTLLKHGVSVIDNCPGTWSVLHRAVRSGSMEICRIIIDKGSHIPSEKYLNAIDEWGRTPLYWTSYDGRPHIARLLLDSGADPSIGDDKGNTPLHIACRQEKIGTARVLLDFYAPIQSKNKAGREPFFYCTRVMVKELSVTHGAAISRFHSLDDEDRPLLLCKTVREHDSDGSSCPSCKFETSTVPQERKIHCPWCGMKAIYISNYEVLSGNPEIPTPNTEVEFTYTCHHCGLKFRNGWNALNTARPSLYEIGAKTSWNSDDSGFTWSRSWSDNE